MYCTYYCVQSVLPCQFIFVCSRGQYWIPLVKYLMAANFCSIEWQESLGMMTSVVVGFLYMFTENLLISLDIVRSRKFILLCCSCSNVKLRPGVILLYCWTGWGLHLCLYGLPYILSELHPHTWSNLPLFTFVGYRISLYFPCLVRKPWKIWRT